MKAKDTNLLCVPPPPHRDLTYCFTALGIHVSIGVLQITKGPPAQDFFSAFFCSPGHSLLISIMTLTLGLTVKL